ncbi:MAG TPA: D-aminoacylase [Thermoanaerobaculia bacterium]
MKTLAALCALALTACATTPIAKAPETMLDLKITNGRILDGTGAPWFRGDVGVRGDTIVALGNLRHLDAKRTIDAQDRIVSPGFIDLLGQSQGTIFHDPALEAKVRQGVTTEVTGEGHSPGPVAGPPTERRPWSTLGEYLDLIDKQGVAVNFAFFVGASNARELVIGDTNRQPTADELHRMEEIIDQAMREGAIGISTSLIYVPAMYSTTEEIIALARVAAKHGGMYFTHMRDEGDRIDMGLDEAFRIGREAPIPLNIWHLKVGGKANWGRMPHVVGRIEAERAKGLDVAANVYPYPASGTGLSTLAPDWAMEGGYDEFRKRLADPEQREKIRETLKAQIAKRAPKGIFVSYIFNREMAQYEKKYMEEIAQLMGVSEDEALIRLFSGNETSPRVIFFSMHEDDVQYALKQPWVSAGADSGAAPPAARASNQASHPRGYGTFPRIVGHYVRDLKLFTLEEAVRKLTSQAALRVGFHDRGILREGMKADLIVFDPATIADKSWFDDPHHFSVGVSDVVVNGVPVLQNGTMTGALPGKTIRGKGYTGKGAKR